MTSEKEWREFRRRKKREYKAMRREAKRQHRLERIEARHQARLKRIQDGNPIWLRVLTALMDVAAGEILFKRP